MMNLCHACLSSQHVSLTESDALHDFSPPFLCLSPIFLRPSHCCSLHSPKRRVDRFSHFAQRTIECPTPITLQSATTFPPNNFPLFFGDRIPHIIHGTLSLPESSSQTASRSFSYGSQTLCCTMRCQWGIKPPKLPLPVGISSPRRRRPKSRP